MASEFDMHKIEKILLQTVAHKGLIQQSPHLLGLCKMAVLALHQVWMDSDDIYPLHPDWCHEPEVWFGKGFANAIVIRGNNSVFIEQPKLELALAIFGYQLFSRTFKIVYELGITEKDNDFDRLSQFREELYLFTANLDNPELPTADAPELQSKDLFLELLAVFKSATIKEEPSAASSLNDLRACQAAGDLVGFIGATCLVILNKMLKN